MDERHDGSLSPDDFDRKIERYQSGEQASEAGGNEAPEVELARRLVALRTHPTAPATPPWRERKRRLAWLGPAGVLGLLALTGALMVSTSLWMNRANQTFGAEETRPAMIPATRPSSPSLMESGHDRSEPLPGQRTQPTEGLDYKAPTATSATKLESSDASTGGSTESRSATQSSGFSAPSATPKSASNRVRATYHPTTAPPPAHPTDSPPRPTAYPTATALPHPTGHPSAHPTSPPTPHPTALPTALPTTHPTAHPTAHATEHPTALPTEHPTSHPTSPTAHPTANPTSHPTAEPTSHTSKGQPHSDHRSWLHATREGSER